MKWLLLCPVCTLTCLAGCTALIWHTVTMPVFSRHGWSCPFQESLFPGGYGSESHQPIGGLKWMLPLWSTHTHRLLQCPQRFRVAKCFTHAQEGNSAGRYVQRSLLVQTNVYCFGWIPGDYYFYFWALGYTGSILVLSPASYVNTHFNGWTQLTSVQVYLCSHRDCLWELPRHS